MAQSDQENSLQPMNMLPMTDEQTQELQRQFDLLIDLADEEVASLQECAKCGHDYEKEIDDVRQLEADVNHVRSCIKSVVKMAELLQEAIIQWPQFDSDSQVSGADLVDWFALWRTNAKLAINGFEIGQNENDSSDAT